MHWHYHLGRKAFYQSTLRGACWGGEDFQKLMKRITASCTIRTQLHDVARHALVKYRWALHIFELAQQWKNAPNQPVPSLRVRSRCTAFVLARTVTARCAARMREHPFEPRFRFDELSHAIYAIIGPMGPPVTHHFAANHIARALYIRMRTWICVDFC